MEMVFKRIFERKRFSFPSLERYLCFKNIAPIFKCCIKRVILSNKAVAQFRHGEKQLKKAFDITHVMKSAKVLEIVVESMFNDEQHMLLKIQKKNFLDDEETSSKTSEPEPVDVFNDKTKVMERLSIKKQVNKVLEKISSSKMSTLDWRLVYGIVEKDFKKHENMKNLKSGFMQKIRQSRSILES